MVCQSLDVTIIKMGRKLTEEILSLTRINLKMNKWNKLPSTENSWICFHQWTFLVLPLFSSSPTRTSSLFDLFLFPLSCHLLLLSSWSFFLLFNCLYNSPNKLQLILCKILLYSFDFVHWHWAKLISSNLYNNFIIRFVVVMLY